MNIFGEGFNESIVNQINQRQKVYGSINRTNEQLLNLTNKNAWCKLISSVDITERYDEEGNKKDYPGSALDRLKLIEVPETYGGSNLAKSFILYNGISQMSTDSNVLNQNSDFVRDGSIINNGAYGLGGLEFGLRPMPGIISAEIKTLNRGSIKESTVKIKAFNRIQFQILDTLYIRLGFPILLEWGHSSYFDNNGVYQSSPDFSIAQDFLNGKLRKLNSGEVLNDFNYNNILKLIQQQRLSSQGNYDALLGKVKNFKWSFNKDGSYDIDLSIISLGDIIESLNIFRPLNFKLDADDKEEEDEDKKESVDANESGQDIIEAFKISSEIGRIFYNAMKKVDDADSEGGGVSYGVKVYSWPEKEIDLYTGKKDIAYVEFDGGGTNPDFYYYRLGSFLKMIQERCLIYDINGKETESPIINIDYDEYNFMYQSVHQVSVDPRICIYRKTLNNVKTIKLYPTLEPFEVTIDDKTTVGSIMDIYISMSYILTLMEANKDENGNLPLIVLLEKICEGINTSSGYKNKLTVTIDDEKSMVKIMDDLPLPNQSSIITYLKSKKIEISSEEEKLATFDIYGYSGAFGENSNAGFIKDFSFSTELTPALATMITIGATASGKVVGEDATALSKWNVALKNRVTENLVDSTKKKSNVSKNTLKVASEDERIKNEFSEYYEKYYDFIIDELAPDKLNWVPDDFDSMKNVLKQLLIAEQAIVSSKAQKDAKNQASHEKAPGSLNTGFIPFSMNLTLDGLSGMKIYQQFKIHSEFLPSNYPNAFKLLIKSITHNISNNKWETKLETMAATTVVAVGDSSAPSPTKYATPQASSATNSKAQSRINNNNTVVDTKLYPNILFKNIGLGNPLEDKINPKLLSDVNAAAVASGVKVTITTAVSGHHVSPPSRHPSGNGIDISLLDGIAINPKASNRAKIDAFLTQLIKIGYVKNAESGRPKAVLTFGFPNHETHIHVSVKA